MTDEARRNVSMTLFMWIIGGLCVGFGGLIGVAWNDSISRTSEVAARFEKDFRDDRKEMQRIEDMIANSLLGLQKQVQSAQEFNTAHRVRIWDRLQAQELLLQTVSGNIKGLEVGQLHTSKQVDRLVERLIGKAND